MLKLRASDLDSWVDFIEPEREEFEISQAEFIAKLLRKIPQTEGMEAGTAFHSVLEKATLGDEFGGTDANGYMFEFDCDIDLSLPPEREAFVEKVYQTSVGPVLLRGRVDGRDPATATVTDYKLTTSTFDAKRYATSLQWKAYLDMTGDRRFEYLVFSAHRKDVNVTIRELHRLVFWRYPEMHDDVKRRVEELAEFVTRHVPEMAA